MWFWIVWVALAVLGYRYHHSRKKYGAANVVAGLGIFGFLCFLFTLIPNQSTPTTTTVAVAQTDAQTVAPTPEPTPAPTDPPTPKPDMHAKRVEYHDFWNKTVGNLAMVYVCLNYAAKSLEGGDSVTASKFLSQGEKFAGNAESATFDNVPSDWDNDDIKLNLFSAANKLKDGLGKARSYLDDQKPSEMAEAQDDSQTALAYVQQATEAAQTSYVSMGGKSSDLETMQDQAQGIIKSFDSIVGSN